MVTGCAVPCVVDPGGAVRGVLEGKARARGLVDQNTFARVLQFQIQHHSCRGIDREESVGGALIHWAIACDGDRTVIVRSASVAAQPVVHLAKTVVDNHGNIGCRCASAQGRVGACAVCIQQRRRSERCGQREVFAPFVTTVLQGRHSNIENAVSRRQCEDAAIAHHRARANRCGQARDHLHGGGRQIAGNRCRAIAEQQLDVCAHGLGLVQAHFKDCIAAFRHVAHPRDGERWRIGHHVDGEFGRVAIQRRRSAIVDRHREHACRLGRCRLGVAVTQGLDQSFGLGLRDQTTAGIAENQARNTAADSGRGAPGHTAQVKGGNARSVRKVQSDGAVGSDARDGQHFIGTVEDLRGGNAQGNRLER